MNLARKYRSKNFAEIVGQDYVKKSILNSLRSNNVSHAFLFFGSRGTGKTSLARLIARAINCQNLQNGEPCNECEMCIAANEDRLVDLIEIDAASNRGIDEIRALKEKIGFSPSFAKSKIYIIDEVHMMTKEAFNALLKTLEEPPSHAYFILATTERHKIPETIQSRCQIFAFQKFTNEQIAGRLQEICEREGIKFDRDALLAIAAESAGGMRDAIFLLEQHSSDGEIFSKNLAEELGITPFTSLQNFYNLLVERKMSEAVDYISEVAAEGFSLSNFSKNFLSFLREKMLESLDKNDGSLAEILEMIRIFSRAHIDLKDAVIPSLPLEIAVVTIGQGEKEEKTTGGWFSFNKKEEKEVKEKKEEKEVKEVVLDDNPKENIETKINPVFKAEEINTENVEKSWPQIIDRVSNFALKMALKQGRIKEANNKKIIISFASSSLKEKVDSPSGNNDLAKAFEDFFKIPLKIQTILENISLEPINTNQDIDDNDDGKNLSGKDLEDAVNEIFGNK